MATICLVSSCGGHFMELIQLLPAIKKYDFYILTEKNIASKSILNKFPFSEDRREAFKLSPKGEFFIDVNFCFLFLGKKIIKMYD